MTGDYATPTAFRRALTDRLRVLATTSPWALPQLQRQFGYDRLLERLYCRDDGWVVKGATALLARGIGVRATIDVDLYRAVDPDAAEAELRAAARTDLGDWFAFEIGPARPAGDAASARRLPVAARVGNTVWASFHVDLAATDLQMTGLPDRVPALTRLGITSMKQHGYRAYPLVDHVADKVAAMHETHGRTAAPSTRFRDLVDLVAISLATSLTAKTLISAVRFEAARRGLALPERLGVPDRQAWTQGYAAEARRSLLSEAMTLDEALDVAGAFLDPVLDGTARGRWDQVTRTWSRAR